MYFSIDICEDQTKGLYNIDFQVGVCPLERRHIDIKKLWDSHRVYNFI